MFITILLLPERQVGEASGTMFFSEIGDNWTQAYVYIFVSKGLFFIRRQMRRDRLYFIKR
jgi:hypothetical protein